MSSSVVTKQIQINQDTANRLNRVARSRRISEDQVIEKALSVLFNFVDIFQDEEDDEQINWAALSERSLNRVWDNDEDSIYDNWRELYNVPAG